MFFWTQATKPLLEIAGLGRGNLIFAVSGTTSGQSVSWQNNNSNPKFQGRHF